MGITIVLLLKGTEPFENWLERPCTFLMWGGVELPEGGDRGSWLKLGLQVEDSRRWEEQREVIYAKESYLTPPLKEATEEGLPGLPPWNCSPDSLETARTPSTL